MQKISFNEGWEYGHIGEDWRLSVTLPHDAMLSEKRSALSAGGKNTGWYEGYDYVYEKKFPVPSEWKDKHIVFEFEGVYRNAKVYINGQLAGGRAYGYSDFYVDADKFLKYGEENRIKVEAFNADQPNSRWYSGAGIYRPVWVRVMPQNHILTDGIKIKTIDYKNPLVSVSVKTNAAGSLKIEIMDNGKPVTSVKLSSDGKEAAEAELSVPSAKLWSPEKPYLYTLRVTFGDDVREEKFGVRVLECNAAGGLKINGERVILRGACIHHDNGILGAAGHPFAEERKIKLLQQYGYNAIRSAHNPVSKATLDACDRLGMLVMDEYVDMWYIHKNKYDFASQFADEWRGDLASMVAKDYNHPCVVLYSIGNEVAETGQDDRPVTCGINIFFNLLYSLGFGIYSDKKAETAAQAPKKKKSVGSEFFNDLAGLLGATTMKIGATLPGCDKHKRRIRRNGRRWLQLRHFKV